MRLSGKLLMSFCLMVIAVGVVITSLEWPFKTALFPMIVSVFLFLGALTDFLLNLFGSEAGVSNQGIVDFQLSDEIDQTTATRRTLVAFAWIIGFFLLILLLGFLIAVPVMVFTFLKFQANERWGISLLLSALALAFFFTLFIWMLDIPFSPGWIVEGIRRL